MNITSGVCSRHTESVMHFQLAFILNFISLCVTAAHCVSRNIALPQATFEVTTPSLRTAVHKACLSPHAGPGYARKQTHTLQSPPFSLQARTPIPNSLRPLTSLHSLRCIHNQLGSKSISHIPCFPFDIQIDLFSGSPANKKNSLAESNLVTNSSLSLSAHPFLSNAQYIVESLCCAMVFWFMYNSIMFP